MHCRNLREVRVSRLMPAMAGSRSGLKQLVLFPSDLPGQRTQGVIIRISIVSHARYGVQTDLDLIFQIFIADAMAALGSSHRSGRGQRLPSRAAAVHSARCVWRKILARGESV